MKKPVVNLAVNAGFVVRVVRKPSRSDQWLIQLNKSFIKKKVANNPTIIGKSHPMRDLGLM
jgi:hypothetical protein